jgi:hypothetical protein
MSTPNGQRQRAPAVIAENASDSIGSPRSPGITSPGGPAGNNGDAEKPAPTQDVSTASVPARTLGSTDSRGSDVIGSAGRSDNGVAEGAERAVLLATKLHVPAIGGQLVHRAALLDALSAGQRRKLTLLSAPAGWGKTTLLAQWALGAGEDQRFGWLSLDRSDNDPVWFTAAHPQTRVEPRHLPMAQQLAALRSGQLEVSFMREKPPGPEFDTMLVARENLGVLLAEELAARLAGPEGIRLDALAGLDWVGFPRSNSPAWYDELAAILRTHGTDAGTADSGDQFPIPSVMFTAVTSGRAFALAPPLWAHPIPHTVVWTPLDDDPVVRRTWAVWPANSRRRDIGQLIAAFDEPVSSCQVARDTDGPENQMAAGLEDTRPASRDSQCGTGGTRVRHVASAAH